MKNILLGSIVLILLASCNNSDSAPIPKETPYSAYRSTNQSLWLDHTSERTIFRIWSPTANAIKINLYEKGNDGQPIKVFNMAQGSEHVWHHKERGDLSGKYYTYQVTTPVGTLDETPGIYAQAVGVNGHRAMILDMTSTNPSGWASDKRISKSANDAIIYELHVRDITMNPNSGSSDSGKYLGLIESGTYGPENVSTGIDHMLELGITHIHLLPSYDHYSIDETKLDSAQYNWGYDPQNYNVPEGSYSSDPYNAEVRIREFKEMVKAFHDNGIGVILDVVYNHTGITEGSNFNQEVPGYYYRHKDDGSLSDASACGNETASDRAMMQKFIRASINYWATEYHLDGFRFDLMAIHDIGTMNAITDDLKALDPHIMVYGEGWTAGDSPLPESERALKKHGIQMPNVSVFSDDIRDGLKGSVFEDKDNGFASGKAKMEESIKFGIVGSLQHDQVDYTAVNYSNAPYATHPWEVINYVSCHDNHTLYDKLVISRPDASPEDIKRMHMLANAVVLTSQGIPFLHAGVEMMRTKGGEHNSYKSSDAVNQIDWSQKVKNSDIMAYHRLLIQLRKEHPAFRMKTGDQVRKHLRFLETIPGVVAFTLSDNANDDLWKNIMVVHNANNHDIVIPINGEWKNAIPSNQNNIGYIGQAENESMVTISRISSMILYRK